MAEPHVQRVLDEKAQLEDRIAKLDKFIDDPAFKAIPAAHQKLLLQQAAVMKDYSTILNQRLALFPVAHTK
jgi:hypothetical protein